MHIYSDLNQVHINIDMFIAVSLITTTSYPASAVSPNADPAAFSISHIFVSTQKSIKSKGE